MSNLKIRNYQTFKQLQEAYRQGMIDLDAVFVYASQVKDAYNYFNHWLTYDSKLRIKTRQKIRDKLIDIFDIR